MELINGEFKGGPGGGERLQIQLRILRPEQFLELIGADALIPTGSAVLESDALGAQCSLLGASIARISPSKSFSRSAVRSKDPMCIGARPAVRDVLAERLGSRAD